MDKKDNNPPAGGDPTRKESVPNVVVKKEKNEAEKIYGMTEAADTLKLKHERLFPLNPPQKQKRLSQMFSVPRGVPHTKRTPGFFAHYIRDIGGVEVKSSRVFGPSQTLIKMFMKKSCSPEMIETIREMHCRYAMENLFFIKANSTYVLVFEPSPFLRDGMDRRLARCLSSSRRRWYAVNLIRFPTSSQVVAAQIVRNFARVYSEEQTSAEPEEFQKDVKRLIHYCTGIERALMPEGRMEMTNHFELSWHRIRKRVLERMLEEANKQTPASHTNFLAGMPFNITTIAELVSQINLMIGECNALWEKEIEGEVVLSDGPLMGEGEDVESIEVAMGAQQMQYEGEMEIRTVQRTANQSMQQMQQAQSIPWVPPAHELPAASSRMNQIYQYQKQHRTMQKGGGDTLEMPRGGTAAAAGGSSSMQGNGTAARGGPVSQMTPSRGERAEGEGLRMRIRRDEHNQHFVDRTPSASPSTSTTHIRETTVQETPARAPSSAAATPQQQQQSMQPPPPLQQTPRPTRQSGTAFGMQQERGVGTPPPLGQSPFQSSVHLFVLGENGVLQSVPSVVYVQQTEQGLIEVAPPSPQPQFVITIPSMGSSGRARSHSGSVRRRVSRGQQILRRSSVYGDSGSEDSAEDERRKQRVKERRKEEEKRKKDEEERREKEERERKDKEDKEEEEIRKKEEEEAEERKKKENERMELEKVRKEEELKAAVMERTRLSEEERKTREKDEEEEAARKKAVEEARDQGVRVLAADSSDGSGEEDGMASEDEVVPESIFTQSDHDEEREEEIAPSAATTTDTVEKRREGEECAAEMTPVTGAPSVPLPLLAPLSRVLRKEADSDIEIVFAGPGEKKQMSAGYCEVVKELIEVKKELDEKADNEVIYLKQTKSVEGSRPSRVARRNRGSLDGSIKEKQGEVKEEEEDNSMDQQKGVQSSGIPPVVGPSRNTMERSRSETTVKTEEEEEKREGSTLTQRARETNSTNTEITEMKSAVKEEEMEEEEEDVATMRERRDGDNEETMEDTMNRSAEGDEEGMERERSVLEAMPQESSSQVPVTGALSDATAATAAATGVPPSESLPMETPPLSAVTVAPVPTVPNGPMEVPQVTGLETALPVSTPSPRPLPIRVSSHGEKSATLSPRRPPLKTRLSAQMIKTIEKVDSYTLPYQGRIDELEGRAEKETSEQREKEKEEVQVIREVPASESDPHTLRFHVMRGEAATLSEDRRRAMREESIDSHSKAVVFTNRPLYKGERVTLRVIEISPEWKGKIRLGLTTKDPLEYKSRQAIPKQLKTVDAERDMHHFTYLYDSGSTSTVKMGTIMEVELSEKGDVMKYAMDGVEMGTLGGGLQLAHPMWMSVDIYGFVKGMEIVHSVFPPQDSLGMEAAAGDENTRRFKKEVDESMMGVKEEVKNEELPSQPPPAAAAAVGEEQSLTATVETAVVSEKEGREIPPTPTENLPLDTVAVDSSEDTVEKPAEEGREDESAVEVEGEGVTSEEEGEVTESVEDKEVEEEDGEIAIGRVGKRAIEKEVGQLEEGDEPPMKKMRIHIEQPTELIVEKEKHEEDQDVVEEEGKDEEKESEESQMDGVISTEEEAEEVQMDRVEMTENGISVMGEENEKGEKEEAVVVGMEEDELMEDTGEKIEKETEADGVIMDGEKEEEAASEHATVKEGREMEESNEMMICPGEKIGVSDQTESMGTEEEKETIIPIDSTVEESMEVEEMPPAPAPPRRRSLFGPGCLSFNQTLDGKEKNEEENEQKMEVDEEETIEMTETVPTRGLSLFGPGSASFTLLLNKMHDKKF